jgi:hypothetical protein
MKLLSLHWAHSAALAEDGWVRITSHTINGMCGIFMDGGRIVEESGFVNLVDFVDEFVAGHRAIKSNG